MRTLTIVATGMAAMLTALSCAVAAEANTSASASSSAPAATTPANSPPAPAAATQPVQSILLRAVTVTNDLERSLLFYRDILGQEVVEDNKLSAERSAQWLDVSPQAEIRFVVLRGKAEYPGGPITGGRIAFIAIREPDGRKLPPGHANRRGAQGDMILPHRVRGLDTIYARLQAEGFQVLFAPRVTPSGLSRNMMVYDPNGHIVELFEMR